MTKPGIDTTVCAGRIFAASLFQASAEHVKRSKGGGALRDTPDELISIWGIGAANLARWKGLPVSAAPPLIPADLLN